MKSDAILIQAARLLETLFLELGATARVSAPEHPVSDGPDLWCHGELDGRVFTTPVLVRPRFAAADLERSPLLAQGDSILVVPRLGPSAREQLRSRGINHADFSGIAYLRLPGIRVDRERSDRRAAITWIPAEREINPFSKKASRILRVLLADTSASVRISDLAVNAGVAVGWASNVADALVKRGYAAHDASGVRVVDAVAAIADWTRAYDWRRNAAQSFVVPFEREQLFKRMATFCNGRAVPWGLTLLGAAERRVGYVRPAGATHVYCSAPSESERMALLEHLFAEQTTGEGNLVLLDPYHGPGAYAGSDEVRGARVVSELQLFLDLVKFPLRGIEAAEMLLRQRLGAALNLDAAGIARLLQAVG